MHREEFTLGHYQVFALLDKYRIGKYMRFLGAAFLVSIICFTANAQERDLFGTWQIVSFRFGEGVSVGSRDAKKLLGMKLQFGDKRAVSGHEVCASAVYKSKRMTADEFRDDFRTSLKSIGIKGDHVDIVDVACEGNDWTVPGATLLKVRSGQMLTIWDGVFFILKKQRAAHKSR
jgi:hypothetical protein